MTRGHDSSGNGELKSAKKAYQNAVAVGNRQEEARWANVIGDILKNRGEYVEALKWLRIDYEVSVKYLPEKQLLPTCQSLGEVYLRLQDYKHALIYQKKHLELAKDNNDLVEQQRACTQLGRTYHEMFLNSDDDHYSVRNAKKYFKSAMKLAQTLKENPPADKSSFLKECIDAHNNIGMLEMDLDNIEEAEKILTRGLEICEEEEVISDDDGRSRLHHNLGNVYIKLRNEEKAIQHITKDILICRRIGHCQGEAKGYINLGVLNYQIHEYGKAIDCYQKALNLARSMEDEDALVAHISDNIETVKQAIKVDDELKKEEQKLKKLMRNMDFNKGKAGERKCLLQQNAGLDRLIETSSMIFKWEKHLGFAKKKKKIATELCDKEKLSDSFLVLGESYQKQREFSKALKWCMKSWEAYKAIGNLEGQAMAKINIGDVLDSDGDFEGALHAFEEGYRIACQAKFPSVQLLALENMHYSHMIRFDNVEEARRLQKLIDGLKESKANELVAKTEAAECCSETDTEGEDQLSNSGFIESCSPVSKSSLIKSKYCANAEESEDDEPLVSLLHSIKGSSNLKHGHLATPTDVNLPTEDSSRSMSRLTGSQAVVGRKRMRVILSDDEDGMLDAAESFRGRSHKSSAEDVATSGEVRSQNNLQGLACGFQNVSPVDSKGALSDCTPVKPEESICSFKSRSSQLAAQDAKDFKIFNSYEQRMTFRIDEDFVDIDLGSCMVGDKLSIEHMKVEVACLYYLQLPSEKRSKGLLPIIQHMKCDGRALEPLEPIDAFKNQLWGKAWIEVSISGWVQKRLMKLYIDSCKELSETPNFKLLKKLYNLQVSEDEVVVSDCELQDMSAAPLLNALHVHKTVAVLDLSHNLLGNGTMEKLQQLFASSSQKYGGLVLDLHCNCFGSTALFQICECPVLFARLEVLNISGNRLTDACASYLSTILQKCKALYSLNIERCSITTRTIQKIADSLDSESILSQLYLGYNHPVSGNTITNLLAKLATLKGFSELNLNGLKIGKPVVDSLCQLFKTSCLSGLMLGSTNIGMDGALQMIDSLSNGTQELVKLDMSSCSLTSEYIFRLNAAISLTSSLLVLNLSENSIMKEGGNALSNLLTNPQCCLKTLVLCKCKLGLVGLLHLLQSLAENCFLEELNLAGNAYLDEYDFLLNCSVTLEEKSNPLETDMNFIDFSCKDSLPAEETVSKEPCSLNTDCNQLEVADSEDKQDKVSDFSDVCMSSLLKDPLNLRSQYIRDLSTAIIKAKHLQLLDLSNNGFSEEAAEALHTAWSLDSRSSSAQKHIDKHTVHLSVQSNKCCGMKPCCRRI